MTPKQPSSGQLILAERLLGVPLGSITDGAGDDVRLFAAEQALTGYAALLGDLGGSVSNDPDDLAAFHAFHESLLPLARHVTVANNAQAWQPEHHPDDTARDNFQRVMIASGLDALQRYREPLVSLDANQKVANAKLMTAPTGTGKTLIEAVTLSVSGIGTAPLRQNPYGDTVPMPLRGLLVVDNRQLMSQFMGYSGNNTFRRFFGRDINITPYWGDEHNASGDVVIATRQILASAVARGAIKFEDYPLIVVDEAQLLLGTRMQGLLHKMASQSRVIGLTATPAYELRKRDLRMQFEHTSAGSLRKFVEDGILSDVRLYSYQSSPENGSQESIAIRLAVNAINKGLKVAAYCKQGKGSVQAIALADGVNRALKKEQSEYQEVARAVGAFNKPQKNREIEAAYDTGTYRMLSSVGLLRVGWDADVDFVIFLDESGSWVNVEQGIGRAMRPSGRTAHIAEILPKDLPNRRLVSIFDVFGLAKLVSGTYIGPAEIDFDHWKAARHAQANPRTPGKSPKTAAARSSEGITKGFQADQVLSSASEAESTGVDVRPETIEQSMAFVPEELLPVLITPQPVRYVTVSAAERIRQGEPPEGQKALQELAAKYRVPYSILRVILDEQNFSYIGVFARRSDPESEFERWYGKDADEWLAENPPEEFARSMEFTEAQLAAMVGVRSSSISYFLRKEKLHGSNVIRRGAKNRRLRHYDMTVAQKVLDEYSNEDAETATATDVMVRTLALEYGESVYHKIREAKHQGKINPKRKRPHPDAPQTLDARQALPFHLTEQEAGLIVAACGKIVLATIEDMSIRDIAAVAGVSHATVQKSLTPADIALMTSKRPSLRARDFDYVPEEYGLQIAARVRPREIPIARTAFPVILARSPLRRKESVRDLLRRSGFEAPMEVMNLGGVNMQQIHTYPWSAMQKLEKIHPPGREHIQIDYDLLTLPNIYDDERAVVLATTVLNHYLGEERVDQEPIRKVFMAREERAHTTDQATSLQGDRMTIVEALVILQCDRSALSILNSRLKKPDDALHKEPDGSVTLSRAYVQYLSEALAHMPYAGEWVSQRVLDQRLEVLGQTTFDIMKIARLAQSSYDIRRSAEGYAAMYFKPTAAKLLMDTAHRRKRRPANA